MDAIHEILKANGPSRSSAIAQKLQADQQLSAEAARKRLSRVRLPIQSFPVGLLPKGENFIYLEDHLKFENFWPTFLTAMRETGSVYGLALDALTARGGIVPVADFSVVSGAPVSMKKQVASERVLEGLSRAGLVVKSVEAAMGDCIAIGRWELSTPDKIGFRARRLAEGIILDGLREWVRNLGFGSYKRVTIRGDDAELMVGPFKWDLTAPSYLLPLRGGEGKPGFVVSDVFADAVLNEHQVAYFVRKSELLRAGGTAPTLSILVADGFTSEAMRRGKGAGIMMATPSNLFGSRVGFALKELVQTLKNAAAVAAANPNKLAELVENLAAIEGAAGNLRGILFELISAHLARLHAISIEFGVLAKDPGSGKYADIDVLQIVDRGKCVAIECKGRSPGGVVEVEEVDDWLRRIPTFRAYLSQHDRLREAHHSFEMWTSGSFTPDALAKLESEKAKRTKAPIGWKDGLAISEIAKAAKERAIRVAFDNHFLRHPLSMDDG